MRDSVNIPKRHEIKVYMKDGRIYTPIGITEERDVDAAARQDNNFGFTAMEAFPSSRKRVTLRFATGKEMEVMSKDIERIERT